MEEESRSEVQLQAKKLMSNLLEKDLFRKESLPNLEEQTEINGLIAHCGVVNNLESQPDCLSLCEDFFYSNKIEEQLPMFLRDLVIVSENYFYSDPKTEKKDNPVLRAEISQSLFEKSFVEKLGFSSYLQVQKSQEDTVKLLQSAVNLRGYPVEVYFPKGELESKVFQLDPYDMYMDFYYYERVQIFGGLLMLVVTMLMVTTG